MVFGVFKQHKKLLFSLAFFAVFGLTLQIFAAPPTTTYSQGETLDPSCIPGSTNCSVSIIPDQTGNSGKYLTTDGTTASWATISGSGISSMNGLTGATQTFASSTSGSDFSITSSGTVHTFNLPDASGSARGLVTTGTQTFAGAKTFTGAISASNLSGTNTGDQTITLSGDISGSGTGAITTTIGALKVTNAMLAGSIAASKLVGSDIATVGTITSGTWSGTTIAVSKGGTGLTSGTAGGVLAFTGSTTIASSLAGTSGQALISAGNAAVPTWYAPTAGSVLFAGTSGILQQDNSNFFWDDTNNRLGIGDNTPAELLTVGNNDAFQVNSSGNIVTTGTLSVASNNFQVDASGNIATNGTLSAGNAAAFAVDVNGAITAATGITSSGTISFSGLNPSAGLGDVVCIDGSNNLSRDSSGACSPSSARFKHDVTSVGSVLTEINTLRPVSFAYNNDPKNKVRYGFIAEEVNNINPELVVREADGVTPHGVYYIDMIPLLVKGIQELDLKITPLTSLDAQNPNSLASLIKQFLANTQNTILDLYAQIIHADRVETKQLCIGQTCVDENQLKQLLQQQGGGASVSPNPPVVDTGNPPINEVVPSNEEVVPEGDGTIPDPVTPIENTPQNDTPTPTE